jgi:hypothetical protein
LASQPHKVIWRSRIHALGGETLKLYTRTMPESDLEAAESERQSSHDKGRGERDVVGVEREGGRERVRAQRERRDGGTYASTTVAYP